MSQPLLTVTNKNRIWPLRQDFLEKRNREAYTITGFLTLENASSVTCQPFLIFTFTINDADYRFTIVDADYRVSQGRKNSEMLGASANASSELF